MIARHLFFSNVLIFRFSAPQTPAQRYATQLAQLIEMGFSDETANIAAIQAAGLSLSCFLFLFHFLAFFSCLLKVAMFNERLNDYCSNSQQNCVTDLKLNFLVTFHAVQLQIGAFQVLLHEFLCNHHDLDEKSLAHQNQCSLRGKGKTKKERRRKKEETT